MRRALFLAIAVLTSSSLAAAQSEYKRWEVFAGYSHNRVDTGISDEDPDVDDIIDEREGFHGFNTSITRNVSRYIGLKFDFSGHFKEKDFDFPIGVGTSTLNLDSRLLNFLGGVQVKDNSTDATFKPFAHALVGGAHRKIKVTFSGVCIAIVPSPCPNFTQGDTGFAGAVGGGIDIRASNRVDIRVIQFDYNPTRIANNTQHNFRVGVGVVFH
jgi:Outer membrane protein beta-barrel domain